MRTGDRRRYHAVQRGYAYLLLLAGVAVIGITSAATLSLGATMARRDAEEQLIAIGMEYQNALRSYANVQPGAGPFAGSAPGALPNAVWGARGPKQLEELLRDPRFPGVRRHLRKLYLDPMTGKPWAVQRDAEGFIVGVYSMAEGQPFKQDGFGHFGEHANSAPTYQRWIFGFASTPGRTMNPAP